MESFDSHSPYFLTSPEVFTLVFPFLSNHDHFSISFELNFHCPKVHTTWDSLSNDIISSFVKCFKKTSEGGKKTSSSFCRAICPSVSIISLHKVVLESINSISTNLF